jgi:ribonuclease HIII
MRARFYKRMNGFARRYHANIPKHTAAEVQAAVDSILNPPQAERAEVLFIEHMNAREQAMSAYEAGLYVA